jgi:hypothetical protein
MDLKDFLDYLCGVGFAYRVEVPRRVKGENYPRSVPKNSTFFDVDYEYTIGIPKVLQDATRVHINYVEKNNISIPTLETRIASSIADFFESLDRIFSSQTGGTQEGGIVMASKYGGGADATKNKAKYVDDHMINPDGLVYAMGSVGSRHYSRGNLDLTWALYYLKELMSIMEEQRRLASKEQEESHQEKENLPKRGGYRISTEYSEWRFGIINEEGRDPNNPAIGEKIKSKVAQDTLMDPVDGTFFANPGDTVGQCKIWLRLDGTTKEDFIKIEYKPKRD